MKRLTHEEWITKYSDTIKVKVLGKYIDSRTKIKCECTCGNIKEMSPNHIRSGMLCKQDCHRDFYNVVLLERLEPSFNIIQNKPESLVLQCKTCDDVFEADKKHKISCGNCKKLNDKFYTDFEEKYKNKFRLIGNRKTKVECCSCSHVVKVTDVNNIECKSCAKAQKYQKLFDILKQNNVKIISNVTPQTMIAKEKYKMICSCGNETSNTIPRMAKVLNCKKCRTYENYDPVKTYFGKETILYYVRFGSHYKIGITLKNTKLPENSINNRFSRYGDDKPDEIVRYEVFKNGLDAYNLEHQILEKYSHHRLMDPSFGCGWTEVFERDILAI